METLPKRHLTAYQMQPSFYGFDVKAGSKTLHYDLDQKSAKRRIELLHLEDLKAAFDLFIVNADPANREYVKNISGIDRIEAFQFICKTRQMIGGNYDRYLLEDCINEILQKAHYFQGKVKGSAVGNLAIQAAFSVIKDYYEKYLKELNQYNNKFLAQ